MTSRKINLLIIGNFPSHPSTEAFLRKYLKIMDNLFDKIYLFSGDCPEHFKKRVSWNDTRSLVATDGALSTLRLRVYYFILREFKTLFLFRKLLKKEKIDTVVVLGYSLLGLIYIKTKRKKIILHKGGKPFVLSFNILKELSKILFEYFPYWIADIIAVEDKECILFQNLQQFTQKVVIIPLFIEENLFSYKIPFSERKCRIGYVSSLVTEKGINEFLESIPEILKERNDLEIIIGGEGPLQSTVEKKCNKYINVKFLGWIPHENLSNYLNELRLLVFPSYSEGVPNIVLEAMACGTPVLATPVGGIPGIIKDGDTGFLLKSNSSAHIAAKVIELINMPNLLGKVSTNAYVYVRENFSFEKTIAIWQKTIAKLV